MIKSGTGTFTLSGTSAYSGGTQVQAGVMNITGSVNSSGYFYNGITTAGNAVTNITGTLSAPYLIVGNTAGINGAVNLNGGTITLGVDQEYTMNFGRSGGGYGYFNMTGGLVTTTRFQFGGDSSVGTTGTGVGLMSGGTVNNNTYMILARTSTATGEFTITGGTLNRSAATANTNLDLGWDGTGRAEVNVDGGFINNSGQNVVFGGGGNFTGTGIVNLNAGTLTTNSFTKNATVTSIPRI